MITAYPSSGNLIVTFLDNVRRYRINSVKGINPTLINVNGELMYIYIKNLSPAQLSNDNPDIWRIQLPKRTEFEEIQNSDHMFLLFGYDYLRKVYTTWNPYWCKQRLNIAESCSMYSRLSLQKRVASTQKIEKMQLQKDGDVVCIPASLLASYLMNIKDYYPEESIYIPIGSSIQKRVQSEFYQNENENRNEKEILFNRFWGCFRASEFRSYLQDKGYTKATVSNYVSKLEYILEKGYVEKHKKLFLEYSKLEDYKRAVNRFCWQLDMRSYGELWHKAIIAASRLFLMFAEKKLYGTQSIRIRLSEEDGEEDTIIENDKSHIKKTPKYKLDEFGKLVELDAVIIDRLVPKVRGVDYPDYGSIIIEIKNYYAPQVTEKMTPADWFKLFDSTKWKRIRGRKAQANEGNAIDNSHNRGIAEKRDDENRKDKEKNSNPHLVHVESKLDYDKLHSVFDKKVTSYKYFWFIAIISIAKEKRSLSISFDDIIIRMAAIAWPIAIGDGIDFGERDMMSKYLKDIQKKTYLIRAASSRVVEATLADYYRILGIDKILSPLLANVPYRFLSPWIKFSSNDDVIITSKEETFDGLYSINSNGIIIKTMWWDYIKSHYNELCTFAFNSFLMYLKQYNNDLMLIRLKRDGWSIDK